MICRACRSAALEPVIDLGDHRLPDFTDPGVEPGKPWPLKLVICKFCGLLQLEETTPRHLLYHGRYGFRSGVNEAIRADLKAVTKYALSWYGAVNPGGKPSTWLDIASNDGTLLSFVPPGIKRTGIDPLAHLAADALRHADRIIPDYFRPRHFRPHSQDIITSVSMFYDLDDPLGFTRHVARVLARDGVWVIQQNYAGDMLARNAVDNICHEHLTYFSVLPLLLLVQEAGLQVTDVEYSDVNGGCIRTLVTHQGAAQQQPSVQVALLYENVKMLYAADTWRDWYSLVRGELTSLYRALVSLRADGKRAYLYGASTRGGTFLQIIGAGPELLPYAVERQPAKVGKVMAATGITIISEEEMRQDPPDVLVVSPWFFRDVFTEREKAFLAAGGEMWFPLPQFEVVTG